MNTKIEWFLLPITDWPRMEEKLAARAREGWLIRKLWGGFAIYQRIEPVELTFAVAVYPEARIYEGFDKSKIREFSRQEAENGWQLAAFRHNLQVFYRSADEDGLELRRPFQVGNIASHLKLETVSFSLLLMLNFFQMLQLLPLKPHQFYRNISLMILIWLPFLFLFFISRLALNGHFLYQVSRGLSLENYPLERSPGKRLLNGVSHLSAGIVIIFVLLTLLVETIQSGSQFLIYMLPVMLALGVGFGLRKVFVGRNLDPALKTLAMIAGIVAVVYAISHVTFALLDNQPEASLPENRIALSVQDLGSGQRGSYSDYRESGSVLVPLYYRHYESGGSYQHVSTEMAVARNASLAQRLFNKRLEELRNFNQDLSSAALDFPGFEEAMYAIPSYRDRDGSGGGMLLIRDDRYLISLSVSGDLHDPETQQLFDRTLEEMMSQGNIQWQ